MRILTFIITLLTLSTSLIAQHSGPVQWLSIDEAYKKYEENPKPIFIDVYTDWCGWCKRMDATTFQDMEIANYLNTYFYPVKLDAETKEKINFKGKVYENSQYQKGKSMLDSLVNLQNITTTELSKINKQKDSTIIPSDVLIDRVVFDDIMLKVNGISKVTTTEYQDFYKIYQSLKYAHNDTSMFIPFETLNKITEDEYNSNKTYLLGVTDFSFSKIRQESIDNNDFNQEENYLINNNGDSESFSNHRVFLIYQKYLNLKIGY